MSLKEYLEQVAVAVANDDEADVPPDMPDEERWRDEHDNDNDEADEDLRRVRVQTERPLEPWEVDLRSKLILVKVTDKKTKEEKLAIRPCAANVSTILKLHADWKHVIARNVFHLRTETTRTPSWHPLDMPTVAKPGSWSAADTSRLVNWLARTCIADMSPIHVGPKVVDEAVVVAAEANAIHPVRSYLRSLPAWDGTPRVDALAANYLGGDATAYARSVSACFMIGAVARVMRPGCKHDSMVVLEGLQGKRKSTSIEILAGPWFADSKLPIGSKDAYQQLAGVWIYEIGELSGMSKADVEEVKAFLSSRADRYRPSYERYAVDVPRQTVFVGTTNAAAYLHDVTGGRRFYPLRTGVIDVEALHRDRDQLWAESLHRFENGEPWWLESDNAEAVAEQAARFVVDEWEEKVKGYLEGREHVTVGQVLDGLIFDETDPYGQKRNSMGKWGQREQNRVARVLMRLGWDRKRVRVGKSLEWRYVSPVEASVPRSESEVGT